MIFEKLALCFKTKKLKIFKFCLTKMREFVIIVFVKEKYGKT